MNLFTAESDVTGKRRGIESNKWRGDWNLARELVIGDIEEPEGTLVQRRDFSNKLVVLQVEDVKSPEIEKRGGDVAGNSVSGQDNDLEAVEEREGGREFAGEVVVVEKY